MDFSRVDCSHVVFSPFNPFSSFSMGIKFATLKDCDFQGANLSGAKFNGAYLEWSAEHPTELGEWIEDDSGRSFRQTHYPAFHEADLENASFVESTFSNADFRGAENILKADFSGARGLDTCIFDGDVREQILGSAGHSQQAKTK